MNRKLAALFLLVSLLLQCIMFSACGDGVCTVVFDSNGGSPTPATVEVNRFGKLERPATPQRANAYFDGWYYKGREWDFEKDVVTRDMTLVARWGIPFYGELNDPNLVAKDWDGSEFVVLTPEDGSAALAFDIVDICADGDHDPRDRVAKAVYERNELLKKYYNINTVRRVDSIDYYDVATADILAYTSEYSAYMVPISDALPMALSGYLLDYNSEISYVNLLESWWDVSVIESVSVNNRAYFAMGDINIGDDAATYCVFFNSLIARSCGLPNLYDAVKEGNWTIDNMKRFAMSVSGTPDGSSSSGSLYGDGRYGLFFSVDCASALITSSGNMAFSLFKSGQSIGNNLKSDGWKNAILAVKDIFIMGNPWALNLSRKQMGEELAIENFAADKTLFYISCCGNNAKIIEKINTDHGMLPLPKLDGEQEQYGSAIRYEDATCYVVPYNVSDIDFSGFVIEALCYLSSDEHNGDLSSDLNDGLASVYRYKLCEMYNAYDVGRAEVLDLILNNRVIDLAFLGDVGGINGLVIESVAYSGKEWGDVMERYGDEIDDVMRENIYRLWVGMGGLSN